MTVIKVGVHPDSGGVTEDHKAGVTAERKYLVVCDSVSDDEAVVGAAEGLPQINHKLGSLYLQSRQFNRATAGTPIWTVDCKYGPTPAPQTEAQQLDPEADPIYEWPEVSTSTVHEQREVNKSVDDHLIQMSNSQQPNPLPQRTHAVRQITISRNEPVTTTDQARDVYLMTLNESPFWGYEAERCRISYINSSLATRVTPGGLTYVYQRVTYVIEVAKAAEDWEISFLNRAWEYFDDEGNLVPSLTAAGSPVETLLDADGYKGETATFESYKNYETLDWSPLALPSGYANCRPTQTR